MPLAVIAALLLNADDKQRGEQELADAAKTLAEACGAITEGYDWASEAAAPGNPASQGPLFCKNAVEGLRRSCGRSEVAKKAIAENVKALSCRFEAGASKKGERGGPVLKLDGTTVVAVYDWDTSNMDSATQDWIYEKVKLPGPNGPETVLAKDERPSGVKQLEEAVGALQEKCGKIAVDYDLSSEKAEPARPAWQGYLYCKGLVEGLGQACEIDQAKAKIVKKVKALHCRFQAGVSKKQAVGAAMTVKGTTLDAAYDWNSGNLSDGLRAWVKKKL